jgi:hypothetical protein
MKKTILILMTCASSFCFAEDITTTPIQDAPEQEVVTYVPPKGWKSADLSQLPKVIKSMIVGTGKENFPPSITLAIEPYSGTLKDYLKIVKNINSSEKTEWKDLGKITTKAGMASLSQFDEKSNWGTTRTMTTILVQNGNAYILSATALKSEFANFYKDFFEAMRSFDLNTPKALISKEK